MINDPSSLPQIDLNQADTPALTTLPGIGPKLAERIIRYREEVHPFEEAIEITAVPGISEKIYHQFADRVMVSLPGELAVAEELSDEVEESIPQAEEPDGIAEIETEDVTPTVEAEVAVQETKKASPIQARQEEVYIVQADEEEESVADADLEEGYILSPEEPEDKSGFRRPWLLMLVGTLLGTFLTLLILFLLNGGTLRIDDRIDKNAKVLELGDELSTLQRENDNLSGKIDELEAQVKQFEALSTRLQNTEAEIQILKQARDKLTGEVENMQEETSAMATRVITLEEQAGKLNEQVTTLEEDNAQVKEVIDELQTETGRFDDFLTRLRDLLLVVQGEPDALQASPTVSPTDVTSTPLATPTPTPTPILTPTPAS